MASGSALTFEYVHVVGSRVHAIVPPLSLCGPVLNVRKFSSIPIGPGDLLRSQTLGPRMLEFLAACVRARMNIVISGGTSSGKSTLLGVLSSFVTTQERVITIEDAAELRLAQPHVIGLEARPATVERRGEVTVRDLVRNALRMRPDRIVVGGSGRRGARHAPGDEHRARRIALDGARELRQARALAARDDGADVGRGPADRVSVPRPSRGRPAAVPRKTAK